MNTDVFSEKGKSLINKKKLRYFKKYIKNKEKLDFIDETLKVAEISNCPVIISGGVSSINDIKKAKSLNCLL